MLVLNLFRPPINTMRLIYLSLYCCCFFVHCNLWNTSREKNLTELFIYLKLVGVCCMYVKCDIIISRFVVVNLHQYAICMITLPHAFVYFIWCMYSIFSRQSTKWKKKKFFMTKTPTKISLTSIVWPWSINIFN